MPREHRDDLAAADDGDGLLPHRQVVAPSRVALARRSAARRGAASSSDGGPRGDARPDHVVEEDGRPVVGRTCATATPRVAVVRHPQHEVGEREVGEQLPVADQQVQPLDVVVGQVGAPAHEIAQGCHAASLMSAQLPDEGARRAADGGSRAPRVSGRAVRFRRRCRLLRRSALAESADRDRGLLLPLGASAVVVLARLAAVARGRDRLTVAELAVALLAAALTWSGPSSTAFVVGGRRRGRRRSSGPCPLRRCPLRRTPLRSAPPCIGRVTAWSGDGLGAFGADRGRGRLEAAGFVTAREAAQRDREGGDAGVAHPLDPAERAAPAPESARR